MKHHEIAVFADTLYKIGVQNKKVVDFYDDFKFFIELINKLDDLNDFLLSPRVKRDEKKLFLTNVFGKNLSVEFLAFVNVILAKRCQVYIKRIFNNFEQLVDKHENIARGKVVSVKSLDKSMLDNISKVLSKKFNKKIILRSIINEHIIGGIIIEVEDVRIDMSIQHSLERIKDKILTTKVKGAVS